MRQFFRRQYAGDAEVHDLHLLAAHDHDIGRLDVAVHHAAFMRGGEAVGDLRADLQHTRQRDAFIGHDVAQLGAFQQLHGDIGQVALTANVVDDDHIGVIESAGGLGLAEKTRFVFSARIALHGEVDGLDRDHAGQRGVLGLVHHAHGTASQLGNDLVTTELAGCLVRRIRFVRCHLRFS